MRFTKNIRNSIHPILILFLSSAQAAGNIDPSDNVMDCDACSIFESLSLNGSDSSSEENTPNPLLYSFHPTEEEYAFINEKPPFIEDVLAKTNLKEDLYARIVLKENILTTLKNKLVFAEMELFKIKSFVSQQAIALKKFEDFEQEKVSIAKKNFIYENANSEVAKLYSFKDEQKKTLEDTTDEIRRNIEVLDAYNPNYTLENLEDLENNLEDFYKILKKHDKAKDDLNKTKDDLRKAEVIAKEASDKLNLTRDVAIQTVQEAFKILSETDSKFSEFLTENAAIYNSNHPFQAMGAAAHKNLLALQNDFIKAVYESDKIEKSDAENRFSWVPWFNNFQKIAKKNKFHTAKKALVDGGEIEVANANKKFLDVKKKIERLQKEFDRLNIEFHKITGVFYNPSSEVNCSPSFSAQNKNIGSCGIKNVGNTCFFNSTIQCLLSLPKFVEYFLDTTFDPLNQPISTALKNFIIDYKHGNKVDPRALIRVIAISITLFNGQQQDAHEFLQALLSKIEDEYDDIVSENKESVIKRLFEIQQQDMLKCTSCGFVSSTFVSEKMQILDIKHNVHDSIENILQPDNTAAGWICRRCFKTVNPIKTFSLKSTPKYFIIQLKRFVDTSSKNNAHIDLNYTIKLNDVNYELVGIICHSGNLSEGHYYSFCKRGSWAEFNDDYVKAVDIPRVSGNTPYLLFYSRKNE